MVMEEGTVRSEAENESVETKKVVWIVKEGIQRVNGQA